jgi:hypothetical protein
VRRFNDEVNLRVPPSSPGRHQDHLTRQKASVLARIDAAAEKRFHLLGG